MMSAFEIIGVVAALTGMVLVVTAIRHHAERLPKHTAMLIGGMMMTAFGLVIAGFALVYQNSAPLALNAAQATP
jgi:putative Ca2+/H+ antiporter (TMEM165/GDT1 family)